MGRQLTVVLLVVVSLTAMTGVAGAGMGGADVQAQSATVNCEFPVSSADATGETVTVEEEPEDVVVLGPSAAQVMWEIGAQDKVVGMPVGPYTSYLEGSDSKTNVVNDNLQPVREQVVGLEPDLVLAPNIVQNETVENLRRAGLTVYRFETATSFEDVTAKTELTGRLVGEFDSAAEVAANTRGTVQAVEEAVDGESRPRAYYPLGGGFTAGSNTFIHDIITSAGAENIAAQDIDGYDTFSSELVAQRDPQWLVLQEGIPAPSNDAINGSTAVQQGQTVAVNPDFVNQPGPRTTIVLQTLTETFHPDAASEVDFDNVEPAEQATCSGADGQSGTAADGQTETESPGAFGPGFGPAVALLAIGSLLVLIRRRN